MQNSLGLSLALAACATVSGFAAPTLAYAAPSAAEVEARFKAADQNADGKLTRQEAEAGMPRIAKSFDKLDADKKNYLTLEQVQAAVAK